jgi:hypothetical protein
MTDWLPGSRADQLTVASNWITDLTSARRTAWGIPQDQYNGLAELHGAAEAVLRKAHDDTQRTPVVTVQCKAAFDILEIKLRFFKKHYLLVPPLAGGDLAAMGLAPGGGRSDIPPPRAEAEADLAFPDYHLIDVLNIRPRGEAGDLRSYWGVNIHIGIVGGPSPYGIAAPPAGGRDLPYAKFTRRRRERFDFDGCSGKTVYICLVYENAKGQQGPFGPILSAVIP